MGKKVKIYDIDKKETTSDLKTTLKEVGSIVGSIFGIIETSIAVYEKMNKLNKTNKKLGNVKEVKINKKKNDMSFTRVLGFCLMFVGYYLITLE